MEFSLLPPPRPYRDERDFARMLALLQAGRAAGNAGYYPHPGDLKWWVYYPPLGTSLWEHISVWEDPADSSRLLGWAMIDPSGDCVDVYFQPELYGTDTAVAMFAWAEAAAVPLARAAGKKQAGMFWVIPEDRFRVGWLEDSGHQVRLMDAALSCPLDEPIPDAPIANGFVVRSCRGLAEVEARARAQYGAFGSTALFEQYAQRFTRFMQSPAYAPDADVVAAAADGTIAAFCITWTDAVNKVGLFEPVGTHPDFQRRGLGKAVMCEALRRLRAQGMRQAIVCTGDHNAAALHLYTSLGFRPYTTIRYYGRDLEG